MLFPLIKKDYLIVKKYVLIMFVVAAVIPLFMLWRLPEFAETLGFILSVYFTVSMLFQYVCIKEYQSPKAATLLCAAPFSRKMMVLSKYIFCMLIYVFCCIIYGIETLVIPQLGALDIKLIILTFFVISAFIGIYLPVQYKLGFEKAKYIYSVVIIAFPFILPMLMKMRRNFNLDFLSVLSPFLVYGGIFIISFVILIISVFLSIEIYNKTDLK